MKNLFVKTLFLVLGVGMMMSTQAAVPEVVAPGFPMWVGLEAKNHIAGRVLTPSDLRQRITVVVELQATAFKEQALATAELAGIGANLYRESVVWEEYKLPRALIVYSVVGNLPSGAYAGLRNDKTLKSPLKNAVAAMNIYQGVSFKGGPQAEGKYPFVYVMGPEGEKPVYAGQYGKTGFKDISEVARATRKSIPVWRPYFGSVADDNHYPQLAKCLEKGQPNLTTVLKSIQKGISSKKEDLARESQILYDAINQRRSDLIYLISLEAANCPHMAYFHLQELFARWPSSKKDMASYVEKFKSVPDLEMVAKTFVLYRQCSDPEFSPASLGEAKRLAAQLMKQKPMLEKLKTSSNVMVQNAAFKMLGDIEAVAESLASRVGVGAKTK